MKRDTQRALAIAAGAGLLAWMFRSLGNPSPPAGDGGAFIFPVDPSASRLAALRQTADSAAAARFAAQSEYGHAVARGDIAAADRWAAEKRRLQTIEIDAEREITRLTT